MSQNADDTGVKEPLVLRGSSLTAFRISPSDTNYLVPIVDAVTHAELGVGFTAALEVFDPGGRTPPNTHWTAAELFFVLRGRARADAGDVSVELSAGDSLLVPPGTNHVIENIGTDNLVTFTVMCPNEGFAELIHAGAIVPAAHHLWTTSPNTEPPQ